MQPAALNFTGESLLRSGNHGLSLVRGTTLLSTRTHSLGYVEVALPSLDRIVCVNRAGDRRQIYFLAIIRLDFEAFTTGTAAINVVFDTNGGAGVPSEIDNGLPLGRTVPSEQQSEGGIIAKDFDIGWNLHRCCRVVSTRGSAAGHHCDLDAVATDRNADHGTRQGKRPRDSLWDSHGFQKGGFRFLPLDTSNLVVGTVGQPHRARFGRTTTLRQASHARGHKLPLFANFARRLLRLNQPVPDHS